MLDLAHDATAVRPDERRVVLIVDSDPTFRTFAKRALRDLDVTTIEVSDAEAALWALETNRRPALISVDTRLPRMSGFQLCEQLRAHARMRWVPILMVSSRTELEDHIRALEVGADEFLEKPVRASDYTMMVETLLQSTPTLRERREHADDVAVSVPSASAGASRG